MTFSEDALIQTYFRKAAFSPFALELKDDAACFPVPEGQELVITCDTIVEHVHFFADDPVGAIAQKALRVNLSDLAAKGAIPAGFFLSLALPEQCFETEWLGEFSQALAEDAIYFNCPLMGGDTTRSKGHLVITITALGLVPTGQMVKRTTARAGDILYVTGTIGDAGVGLQLRHCKARTQNPSPIMGEGGSEQREETDEGEKINRFNDSPSPAHASPLASQGTLSHYRRGDLSVLEHRRLIPQPRVEIAHLLQTYATAALDISDGFAGDCMKLLSFSHLGVSINCEDVPISGALLRHCEARSNETIQALHDETLDCRAPLHSARNDEIWPTILSGGDDYEVLFTIAPKHEVKFLQAAQNLPFPVTRLATLNTSGQVKFLLNGAVLELDKVSYSHL